MAERSLSPNGPRLPTARVGRVRPTFGDWLPATRVVPASPRCNHCTKNARFQETQTVPKYFAKRTYQNPVPTGSITTVLSSSFWNSA